MTKKVKKRKAKKAVAKKFRRKDGKRTPRQLQTF